MYNFDFDGPGGSSAAKALAKGDRAGGGGRVPMPCGESQSPLSGPNPSRFED